MATLVVDANVLVGAALGRSLSLLAEQAERGVVLAVPFRQFDETEKIVRTRRTDGAQRIAKVLELIEVLSPDSYAPFEGEARERLLPHGQPDWPVLASALLLRCDIWSADKDFLGTGVATWSNRNIRRVEVTA